jgi:hypothetical protein
MAVGLTTPRPPAAPAVSALFIATAALSARNAPVLPDPHEGASATPGRARPPLSAPGR